MIDSNEISNDEYEYEYAYSDNDDDENAEMDVNDGDFEDDELPSPTHINEKHTQKSPSITPRNEIDESTSIKIINIMMSIMINYFFILYVNCAIHFKK